jgi:hypothetical protein
VDLAVILDRTTMNEQLEVFSQTRTHPVEDQAAGFVNNVQGEEVRAHYRLRTDKLTIPDPRAEASQPSMPRWHKSIVQSRGNKPLLFYSGLLGTKQGQKGF